VGIAGDEVAVADRSLFVPEAWQRAEVERVGRRDLVRTVALWIIVSVIVVALVYAVRAWSKGRSDRRALIAVGALLFVMVIASSANNWPLRAFSLRTVEPLTSQILISVLAMAAGAALLASLVGLLAGVGARYARQEVSVRLVGRLPAWACGVMAALATAGIAAALAALVPPSLPTWPDLKPMAAAWPLAAAVLFGLALIPAVAITLFLLSLIDRLTEGWTRRLPLVALALVVIGVAASVLSGHELWQAIPHGAIEGATAFTFAWLLLRYDLRTVPAFVATGLILEALRAAFLAVTPSGWLSFGVVAAVVALLTWWATRLISNVHELRHPQPPSAAGGAIRGR
jgi:hypothetical protein